MIHVDYFLQILGKRVHHKTSKVFIIKLDDRNLHHADELDNKTEHVFEYDYLHIQYLKLDKKKLL